MKNEFFKNLDRNGYAPSILQQENHCFCCYGNMNLQRHEVFHGSNREKSKMYGLWVQVCPVCHYKIHNGDGTLDKRLKVYGQQSAQTVYGWTESDFRKRFGKNYL